MRKAGRRIGLLTAAALFAASSISVSAKSVENCFDAGYYASSYRDLKEAFGEDEAALYNHYLQYGISEGRSASPFFDVRAYRMRYPDLDKAFGDDWAAYYKHYLEYGIREKRSATASGSVFDAEMYAANNPDLYAAFGDDAAALWEHFLRYGYKEGRMGTAFIPGRSSGSSEEDGDTDAAVSDAMEASEIYIEPVPGISDDFIRGMDASSVLVEENSGVTYYNFAGEEQDVFQTLAEGGVNYIRLRVWNDPYDENGNGYGGGNNDVATAVELGKRATQYGMKVCIDFHYSDFWADPKRQHAPKAWQDMSAEEKCGALYAFTKDSLTEILDAGVDVGMVQVGNEINNGMSGETEVPKVMALLSEGSRAVREISAAYGKDIQVAVHYTNIEDNAEIDDRAAALQEYGVDYDIFGLSYYPFWDGTNENMQTVAKLIQEKYGKKVMIAETSYCYTSEDGDGSGNSFKGTDDLVEGYGATVQSQATMIRDICAAANEAGVLGVFYWEGVWIPVGDADADNSPIWEKYGSGWASSYAADYDPDDAGKYYGGCSWDNQAMFDFDGYPLASLNVFRYLKSGSQASPAVDYIPDVYVVSNVGSAPELPEKVDVIYNNRAYNRQSAVVWNAEQLAAVDTKLGGTYDITGVTEEGAAVTCHLEVKLINLVPNGSFEDGDAEDVREPWEVSWVGDTNPTDFQVKADDAHDGETAFHFFSEDSDMEFEIKQTITGLEEGTYQLYAFAQGQAEEQDFELYAVTGSGEQTASFTVTGWAEWKVPKISRIEVTDGTLTIGVRMKCKAGGWGTVDDFTLNLIPEGMEIEEPDSQEPNYVQNAGFEDWETSWNITNNGADGAVWVGDDNVKTGAKAYRFWSAEAIDFVIEQEITGLESGTYRLSVFSVGGNDMTADNSTLELYAVTDAGEEKEAFMLTDWQHWVNPTISDIEVTDGTLTIGVRIKCPAGSWGSLDDFSLTRISE